MRAEHAEVAQRILQLALVTSKTTTIKEIYERIAPGADGRIRTVPSVVGTETCRLAGGESFLEPSTNLFNMTNKAALADPLYDVRSVFLAAPGYVYINGDLSQAEARVVCAYANDDETLAIFADKTRDVHKWTAATIFGCNEADVTKQQRHLGKMARHALNYGMGWSLFMERINKDADLTGIALSAKRARDIVEAYHLANPKLLAWWRRVEDEVKRCGYIVNAYGRRRDFLSPYLRPNDIIAHKPQSTIAEHLNIGMVAAYDAGLPLALQVYDSVMLESAEADADAHALTLKRCLDFPVDVNGYRLSVPVDVKIGPRWSMLE